MTIPVRTLPGATAVARRPARSFSKRLRGATIAISVLVGLAGVLLVSTGAEAAGTSATCTVNPGVNQVVITTQAAGKDAQSIADVAAADAACEAANAGSATFRARAKIAGNIVVNVVRGATVDIGDEDAAGGINIDSGDISRAGANAGAGTGHLTGGTAAARTAVANNLLIAVIAHEVSGESRAGHNHDDIIADENAVLNELGKTYTRIVACKADGDINWSNGVRLDMAGVNGGGQYNCTSDLFVGGIAELPQGSGTAPLNADGDGGFSTAAVFVAAVAAGAALAGLSGGAWYLRRRFSS